MSTSDFSKESLESLLFDWESGQLDDEGMVRLREKLKSSADARRAYVQHQLISAAMKLDGDAHLESVDQDSEPSTISFGGIRRSAATSIGNLRIGKLLAVAAAILLICSLASRVLYLDFLAKDGSSSVSSLNSAMRDDSLEAKSSGVAIVTGLVDIEFHDEQSTFNVGDALSPGKIGFEAGLAQIEFLSGATLIVEGPADIDLKSASLATIRNGKVRAQVPPAARGFSLEVDDMKVVDLGTEFAISVSPTGADVQVFDGEVEVHSPKKEMQLLTAGQAVMRKSDGDFVSAEVTPDQFVDVASMASRAFDQRTARHESWKAWSEEICQDPRLIAYYSFAELGTKDRKLHSSLKPDNSELDGAIVGARHVTGRWPNKSALEFKRPGDRVRVNIPGEFDSLTFSCWVKIDSLDRWYNSLFLTDSYQQGEPHWQILDSGQLFFSVRHKVDEVDGVGIKGPTHQEILSEPFWNPSMSGRWIHLATTYNAESGLTKHYLDGEVLHEEAISEELRVKTTRIGSASICNWSIPIKPDAEYAVRNLNGSIDEFIIMSSALTDGEIKEIYEHGKP